MEDNSQAVILKHLEPTEQEGFYVVSELPCCPRCERILAYYDGDALLPFLHCYICNDYMYSTETPYLVIGRLTNDF